MDNEIIINNCANCGAPIVYGENHVKVGNHRYCALCASTVTLDEILEDFQNFGDDTIVETNH